MYELNLILENLELSVKHSWEQTRNIMFILAQVNSKKRLKPKDLMSFSWDKKINTPKEVSVDDRNRLTAMAKEYEIIMNNK